MTVRYSVRLLSPDGTYPAESVFAEDFAILGIDEVVWSVVHSPDDPDEYPEGAISWLTIDEIRFYAALSLAERHPRTNGRLWIHAKSHPEELAFPDSDGDVDPAILYERSKLLARRIAADLPSPIPDRRAEPRLIDRDYTDEIFRLIRAIEPERLLHRGLYKYLIAAELRRYPQFLEESALSAFISREAALELLRRKLSSEHDDRLRRSDVLDHLRSVFPTGEPFVDLLESDWEARVLMAHPINEFGEFWSPPVHAEECLDALNTLVCLYRYLLLDEVWEPSEYD